jgi:hypothetical protein
VSGLTAVAVVRVPVVMILSGRGREHAGMTCGGRPGEGMRPALPEYYIHRVCEVVEAIRGRQATRQSQFSHTSRDPGRTPRPGLQHRSLVSQSAAKILFS